MTAYCTDTLRRALLTFFATCFALSFGAASASAQNAPVFDGKAKVAVLGYNGAVSRYNSIDFPHIEKTLKALAPNVEVSFFDPQGNAATQLSQLRSAIVQGADLIALLAFQDPPTTLLTEAKASNIPVVLYIFTPSQVVPDTVKGLVGTDAVLIGKAQAQYVLDKLPKGSRIAIVNGDLAGPYAKGQREGILSLLKEHFDGGYYELVADRSTEQWNTGKAEAHVSSILSAENNRVDAVIIGNDDMAQGALTALRRAGLDSKVLLIGQDATPAALRSILRGEQTATAYRNIYEESGNLAAAVAEVLAGKTPAGFYTQELEISGTKVPYRPTSVAIIDRANLQRVIDDGMITKEVLCEGFDKSVGAPCF